MGERKAVNKYYPPDWTPEQGSLDRYHGQHPLRERARKLGQGILIIRFEMPYNIWCGGCGIHIGMGVRYNAEKKKVGNYYTTPIYRFRMKCHLCDNHFEIETDPKNCDYVIVSGARRKEERWEPSATETVELTDREDAKKMATDAMFKLEHGVKDEQKSKAAQPTLGQLQEVQSVWKDDYAANQLLRQKFREKKRELKAEEVKDNELKERAALDVALVPERAEDIELARKIRYHGEGFDEHRRQRRFEVNSRPLFDSKGKSVDKREKVKQLLGKRKQMQFDSFSSPSKSNSDLGYLGIKVRRKSSTNSEGSTKSPDKDPVIEAHAIKDSSIKDPAIEDPAVKGAAIKDPASKDPITKDRSIEDSVIKDPLIEVPEFRDHKDPASDESNPRTDGDVDVTSSGLAAPDHRSLGLTTATTTDVRPMPSPEVMSRSEIYNGNEGPTSFSRQREDNENEVNEDCLVKQTKVIPESFLISSGVENHRTKDLKSCANLRASTSAVGSLVCCDYTDSSDASDDTT